MSVDHSHDINNQSIQPSDIKSIDAKTWSYDEMQRINIPKNGHCMVGAASKAMQLHGMHSEITEESIFSKLEAELLTEIGFYKKSLTSDTDPLLELRKYINDADFASDFADLILPMIANIFKLRIFILTENVDERKYFLSNRNCIMLPRDSSTETEMETCASHNCSIFLLKTGQHYDTLIEKSTIMTSHVFKPPPKLSERVEPMVHEKAAESVVKTDVKADNSSLADSNITQQPRGKY